MFRLDQISMKKILMKIYFNQQSFIINQSRTVFSEGDATESL